MIIRFTQKLTSAVPSPLKSGRSWKRELRTSSRHYKRIYTVTCPEKNAESMAICAMSEALHNVDLVVNGTAGAVQAASIGSVSTTYGSAAATAVDVSEKGQAKALYRAASLYLDIYRGVS